MTSLDPASERTIGVDVGGTNLRAALVGPGTSLGPVVRRQAGGLPLEDLLAAARDAVEEVAASAPGDVAAVGFGIPSLLDRRTGRSVRCVHLPLDDVPFRELMSERLGRPVAVDNDANCAMLAEWRAGAARGADHALLLTLGTGIGGGLVLDGRLYRGAVGAAGELGHVVVDLDGPPCFGDCPGRGCLEALASGSALVRDATAAASEAPDSALGRALASGRELSGEMVTAAAQDGDPVARKVIAELGTKLGAGLAGLAMAFNPELIVIGGGVATAGDLLLEPARAELARRALDPARRVRIEPAAWGDRAGMLGAGLLALEEAGR